MSKSATAYVLAVVCAAVAFTVYELGALELTRLSLSDWGGVAGFVFVGLLSQAAAIDFGSGRQATSSMAFIPLLAAAVLFPPSVAILAAGVVIGCTELFVVRTSLLKSAFNVAQISLAIGVGGYLYHAVAQDAVVTRGVYLPAFLVLVAVFFAANILLSSMALALYRGSAFGPTLRVVVGPRGGNLLYDVLASPLVVVTVVLYADYRVGGVLLIILPLLLVRHFYLSRKKLADANRDLLSALIKAIETRDPYTSGHSLRVATLARLIAKDMGVTRTQMEIIFNAALLHDVGKIDPMYSVLLRKPHDLTPEERRIIQTHPTRGADLLRDLSSVEKDVVEGVRHHHERFDGMGYPDGLAALDIPLSARIIMLCDSIDAMLSDRPYRSALTVEQVKAELVRCSGLQFDPTIVNIVLKAKTLEKALDLVAEWNGAPEDVSVALLA